MNKFLVIKLKSPWARRHVLGKILKNAFNFVPFWGEKVHLYYLEKHSIIIFSIESNMKNTLYKDSDDNFLIYDGMPYFYNGERTAKHLLEESFVKKLDDIYESTLGTYCLVKISSCGDISAFGDFSGLSPLFFMETHNVVAISNRQMLLNGTCTDSDKFSFNYNALSWLTGQANIIGEDSIFKDVKILRPGTYFHFHSQRGELLVKQFNMQFWNTKDTEELTSNDFDNITDLLIQQCKGISNLPIDSLIMSLTGGKDSRLILALALRSGLIDKVDYLFTNGLEGSPEIEIAKYISSKVGKSHRSIVSKRKDFNLNKTWDLLRYHAFRFEGSICPWDGLGDPAKTSLIELNGMGGEIFSKLVKSHSRLSLNTVGEAMDLFENYQQTTDPLDIQHEDVTVFQKQYLRKYVKDSFEQGINLNDIGDLLYVFNRLTMWSGLISTNTFARTRIFPLINLKATNIAFKGRYSHRQMQRFHYEVMKRAHIDLVNLPFLNDTWDDRLLPYIHEDGIKLSNEKFKTEKVVNSRNMSPWQWAFLENGWDDIIELLLSSPNSGLFDIIDKTKLEEVLLNGTKNITHVIHAKEILSLIEMQLILTGGYVQRMEGSITTESPALHTNLRGIKLESQNGTLIFQEENKNRINVPKDTGYSELLKRVKEKKYNLLSNNIIVKKILGEYNEIFNENDLEFSSDNFNSFDFFKKIKIPSFSYKLPSSCTITKLRLDPSDHVCEFILGKIVIDLDGSKHIISDNGFDRLIPNKHVVLLKKFSNYTLYKAIYKDPYFVFEDLKEVDTSNFKEVKLTVELVTTSSNQSEVFFDIGKGFTEKNKITTKNVYSLIDILNAHLLINQK